MITFSQLGNIGLWGRLGNQLFSVAATIGVAHINKQSFVLPTWAYSDSFANKLPTGTLTDVQIYNQKTFSFSPIRLGTGNWDLRGSFQSERFFIEASEQVRHYFTPAPDLSSYIDEKYSDLFKGETCSLHIRRGDYIRQRAAFPPQPISYYQYAVRQFPRSTRFLIFSDDISWCRIQFKGDNFIFIDGEKDIIDLFLMSRCDHHIISNSSFSWWGAWLNSSPTKKVYCPEFWFGPALSPLPKRYARDLYAHGFIPISPPEINSRIKSLSYAVLYPFYSLFFFILKVGVKVARFLGVYS